MAQNAIAFANNDVITIAWSYDRRPDGCMGFALYRIDHNQKETPLPSHAVFPGDTIRPGQTTRDYPVQKFYWKDVYARLESERTGNRKYRYRVVPLEGRPKGLQPMTSVPDMTTNEVTISPQLPGGIAAYFNRGLLSTQRVARALGANLNPKSLNTLIADPTNGLRASLSSDMVEALIGFLDRTQAGGKIYAALYELNDQELVAKLEGLGHDLEIVLANSVVTSTTTDKKTKKKKTTKSDGNDDARLRLAKSCGPHGKWDRIMPSNHIAHNKFLVYVDAAKRPIAVLLGSTNWTPNGLCAQTNNTLVIQDADVAGRYLDYWKQLAADTEAANGVPKDLQRKAFRGWNSKGKSFPMSGGATLESWFSPNTPGPRGKPKQEKQPNDMAAVVKAIDGAKSAILFLVFYPGSPSVANWTAKASRKDKQLFVRGCVTNKSASEGFYYALKGMTPPPKKQGQKRAIRQDPRVFGAEALDGKHIPKGWQRELLKAGFAIIHDKILVIDPFSDNCVVVTGSHNLGHKASYDNDENLVIVRGDKELATAYTVHVLDVWDHFAWRYLVKREGKQAADQSLETKPEEWLGRYFDAQGKIKSAQLAFWMGAKV